MKRLIFIMVLTVNVLLSASFVFVSASSLATYESDTKKLIEDYFCNNLDLLEKDFEKYGYNVSLQECKVEKVVIKDNEILKSGYMIDLNDSNGFFLLSEDFRILDMSFTGDSYLDFGLTENLVYDINYGYNIQNASKNGQGINNTPTYNSFSGTYENGVIFDPTLYVQDRYGDDYELDSSKLNYDGSSLTQQDGSVYFYNGHTEGNCSLVSAYNFLRDLTYREQLYDLPIDNNSILYEPSLMEPSLYSERINDGNYDIKSGDTAKSFSSLYISTRLAAIAETGDVEGITLAETKDILEDIVYSSGYSTSEVNFSNTSIPLFYQIRSHFDDGETLVFSVLLHPVYGNHSMFAIGYEVYKANFSILGIPYVDYKYLIILRDGHNVINTYLDFDKLVIYGMITSETNLVSGC